MEPKTSAEQNSAGAQSAAEKPRIQEIGNFEIISKLGQGGMGAVYKARQKSLDRIVALKILPASIAKDAQFIERFQGEARASAKLNHTHIVKGIDVGQDPATKLWFFAMEFVDGPSLQDVLKKQETLDEKRALKIVAEIASALECIAAAGMVHRDIKPDNILLTSDGVAKLADLGLAKDLKDDAGLTLSGQALGTPNYMAPEQVRGELAQIDIRTDIYSLGATLFHLVTGQPPFTGETSAVIMAKHLTEAPAKARSVNHKLSAGCSHLIERMMHKKIEQRVQTPGEVVTLINKLLAGETIGKSIATGTRDPAVRSSLGRSRESVGSLTTPTRVKARSSMTRLYVGGAALVVIVITVLAINNGPGESAVVESEKRPDSKEVVINDRSTSPDLQQEKLKKMVSEAQEYEKTSPEDFDEVLGRYERALAAIEGSALPPNFSSDLQGDINRVQERRKKVAADVWSKIAATADAAARDGDYDAALQKLADFPKSLAQLLTDKASSKAAALRAEGEGILEAALRLAEQFSRAADPASGLMELGKVEKIQLSLLSARVKTLKARLENELANAEELERRRGELLAIKKLEDYLARFDAAIIVENMPQKARDVAAAANRDSTLKSVTAQVAAMNDLVVALDEAQRAQDMALAALKGKPFAMGKDLGTIEKVEGGIIYVTISLEGGKLTAKKRVPVKDLSDGQRSSLFQVESPTTPAAKVVSAMLKLTKGNEDLNGALVLLTSAGDFALAGRYRDMIRVRQVGVTEAAAEKAWPALALAASKRCDNPEQGKALLNVLSAYLKEHGQTQFVKGRESEVTAINKKANSVIDVKVYLSDLQEIEVKVGYPNFGKHGDLGYEGQRIRVYGVASPNGISLHPPTNGQSHVAYMLDGRFGYFTAHVAVNDTCGAGNKTPIVFKVLGDGKLLWNSQPIQRSTQNPEPPTEEVVVDVGGVVKLELVVDCPGFYSHAHAVWLEPRLGTARIQKK